VRNLSVTNPHFAALTGGAAPVQHGLMGASVNVPGNFSGEGWRREDRTVMPLPLAGDGQFVRPVRVCFAVREFLGYPSRGGIGQAYGAFAAALAQAGHEVTVAVSEARRSELPAEELEKRVEELGGRLIFLPDLPFRYLPPQRGSDHVLSAYRAWHWLKDQDFEVIHFTEWETLGYYAVSAKRGGLAFQNTLLCVSLRGPSRWCWEGEESAVANLAMLETDFVEQRTAELADLVFAPSRHIVEWVRARGWQLPEPVFHQPNLIRIPELAVPPREPAPIREIVFFGRLQLRKGLTEFCEAIDLLTAEQLSGVTISFLGAHLLAPMDYRAYLNAKAVKWPCEVKCLDGFSRKRALEYLRRPGVLAVMASRLESFSNAVYECQALGIPFLAANTSAIPELIPSEFAGQVLFDLTPRALAEKLVGALAVPPPPIPSCHNPEDAEDHWVRWHNDLASHREIIDTHRPDCGAGPLPRVTVCVAHFNQPELLEQALASLEAQTYENLEVIVVDDGSTRSDVPAFLENLERRFAPRGWRVLRQRNQYVGAARNYAVRESTGEFLLFMDDDNIAHPREVEIFVRAAVCSGINVITCSMETFRGLGAPAPRGEGGRFHNFFLGGPVSVGLYRNTLGDANFFIRKRVFEEVGGFVEAMYLTSEDTNFLIRASFAGHRILVVPKPLYLYRIREDSMFRALPVRRRDRNILSAFESVTPAGAHDALAYARHLYHTTASPAAPGSGALKSRQTVTDLSASPLGYSLSFGSGWHEDEGDRCWSGREGTDSTFLIYAPGAPVPVDFSARIVPAKAGNSLRILWNGTVLEEAFRREHLRLEGLLPKPGFNELRFVAAEPGETAVGTDSRKLGHAFSQISLRPAKAGARQRCVPDLMEVPEWTERTVRVNELPRWGAEAAFGEGWYPDEGARRWSGQAGPRSIVFFETPVPMTIRFRARVDFTAPGNFLTLSFQGQAMTTGFQDREVNVILDLVPDFRNMLVLETRLPPSRPENSGDSRTLACALSNIQITREELTPPVS